MRAKSLTFCVQFLLLILIKNGYPSGLSTNQNFTNIFNNDGNNLSHLLSNVLEKYLEPFQCVLVILDSIYYNIIKSVLFIEFQQRNSMIMITVFEDEDLSAPCNDTRNSLKMGKTNGCQFYLIFLSNGAEISNLLKYGDKHRIINTRENFVLLYDNCLFNEDMKYIWKRIVNVIFIREYGGIKKSFSKRKPIPWFEITTVPFPAPIGNNLVPRRLDIWRDGKFRSGTDLFRDKTANLNKQILRAVTFNHMPAVVKIPLENQLKKTTSRIAIVGYNTIFAYTGIEIELLEIISKAMNFVPELYESINSDEAKWGEKKNVGYTGLLGEMVTSKADFALGDLHYSPQFLDLMDLSIPYNTECLAFLTPESLTYNSWKTLILPFTTPLWAAVLTCLFFIGFVFYGLARFYNKLYKRKERRLIFKNVLNIAKKLDTNTKYALMKKQYYVERREENAAGLYLFKDMPNSILYTYGMLLVVSLPTLPKVLSLRVLTGWYWLYCILVVVAYRASMTAILANPAPRVTIDTLQELVDSRLPTGGWGEMNRHFFQTSLDPLIKYIGGQFEIITNLDETIAKVAQGKFAFYENVHFLKQASVKRQIGFRKNFTTIQNVTGYQQESNIKEEFLTKHELHIMTDCIIHMPISLGLQKNSPIKPRVDKYLRKAFEAGLVKKWLDDVMTPYITAELHNQRKGNIKALMNLEKFFGALVALSVGLFVSIIILLIEIIYFTYVIKRNPNYNKYLRVVITK